MVTKKEDDLKEEIVIVEDEVPQAKKFYSHLKLDKVIPRVRYLKNLDDLKELFKENEIRRFYLVDINLGKGRIEEGIEVIRVIKENDHDALIIVYSGYPDKEHQSLEAGADLFFEKDPVTYEDDLMQIRKSIIRASEYKKKEREWEKITCIYTQIADIDEERNLVRLNCKLEKESLENFERDFQLDHFPNKDKLVVDQPILVQIFEGPGEVRFIFEEVEKSYFKKEDSIDISHLENSSIFKPVGQES